MMSGFKIWFQNLNRIPSDLIFGPKKKRQTKSKKIMILTVFDFFFLKRGSNVIRRAPRCPIFPIFSTHLLFFLYFSGLPIYRVFPIFLGNSGVTYQNFV